MPAQAVQLFSMKNSDNVRRDEMFESLNNKSDQIIQQTNMEKTDNIAGAIFQSKSDISGELVPGLIRKNYSGLLNQEYCNCPICGKRSATELPFRTSAETFRMICAGDPVTS